MTTDPACQDPAAPDTGDLVAADPTRDLEHRASDALVAIGMPSADELAVYWKIASSAANSKMVRPELRGNPDGVLMLLLTGRELGLPQMASLRNLFFIDGNVGMLATMMAALVRRRGHEIKVVERDARHAVVWGRRTDNGDEQTVEWTIQMAALAGLTSKSTWQKYPHTMLVWRAESELCRLLFSDVLMGAIYTPEELGADVDQSGGVSNWNVAAVKKPKAKPTQTGASGETPEPEPKSGGDAEPGPEPESGAGGTTTGQRDEAEHALPPTPPMPVLRRIVDVACERLRTKPARLMTKLGLRIQRNYETATADELWHYLHTDVRERLLAKGLDLPDPADVTLPDDAHPDPDTDADREGVLGFAPGDGPADTDPDTENTAAAEPPAADTK